jgi:long-chain acyl-CoA synthetase
LAETGETVPKDKAELVKQQAAVKIVQSDVAQLTASLVDYERIRRVALLPNEFTIDSGELTPTLKVKRRVIDERFGDVIEELYS